MQVRPTRGKRHHWGLLERGYLQAKLRKQPTFRDVTTRFRAKWPLRSEHRNSILMTCRYPGLGSASDWLKQLIFLAAQPIRSTTQIKEVTRHQYWIYELVSSDVISQGNCCFRREMSHVFSVYLGVIPMIPERLSFWNEFIPSLNISLCFFTWYRDDISFQYKSFHNEFIPVFIPNKTLVLVRNLYPGIM